jgi:hypothetical protein
MQESVGDVSVTHMTHEWDLPKDSDNGREPTQSATGRFLAQASRGDRVRLTRILLTLSALSLLVLPTGSPDSTSEPPSPREGDRGRNCTVDSDTPASGGVLCEREDSKHSSSISPQ